jgi:hypothetical protein
MKAILILFFSALVVNSIFTQDAKSLLLPVNVQYSSANNVDIAVSVGEYFVGTQSNDGILLIVGINPFLQNEDPSAVIELEELGEFTLYPNPFQERLTIDTGLQDNRVLKIQITDLQGRLVWSQNIDQHISRIELDTITLEEAFYCLIITDVGTGLRNTYRLIKS